MQLVRACSGMLLTQRFADFSCQFVSNVKYVLKKCGRVTENILRGGEGGYSVNMDHEMFQYLVSRYNKFHSG